MRRIWMLIAATLMLSVAVWAQATGGGAAPMSPADQSGQRPAPNGQRGTAGSMAQDASTTAPTQDTTNDKNAAHQKTVEGCLVQSNGDWYLATKGEKKFIRLNSSGTADFNSFANQKVRVRGTEGPAAATSSSTGTGATATGESAGANPTHGHASTTASGGTTGAGVSSGNPDTAGNPSNSQNPGATASTTGKPMGETSTLPQSGNSSSITVDQSKVADKALTVTNIEPVSGTCSGMIPSGKDKDKDKSSDKNSSRPY
jgi:hypothetical protein